MGQSELTKIVLLSLGAILCAVFLADIWLIASRGEQASVSNTVRELARQYPVIPFAAGALVAHLFRF
jgi:hypothetical protein